LKQARRLTPEEVINVCDPEEFDFETTEEVPALAGMIGQERATRAMEFGLRMNGTGYNIFMAGPPGTGKTTYAVNMAGLMAGKKPVPRDWVYVYNFDRPDQPQAISLRPGFGRLFVQYMSELVTDAAAEIAKVFESEHYEKERQELMLSLHRKGEEIFKEVEAQIRPYGFALSHGPTGFLTIPLDARGQPLSREDFEALPESYRKLLEERSRVVQQILSDGMRRVRAVERETREALRKLDRDLANAALEPLFRRVAEAFPKEPKVAAYLERVQADMVDRLHVFRTTEERKPPLPMFGPSPDERKETLQRYAVNLLVDHSQSRGAPVVVEANPTYYNLLGKVEFVGHMGGLTTNHTQIKAGALHRANGGYLILQAMDVLMSPGAWEALKRALKTSRLYIEALGAQAGFVPMRSMRPEPIPLDVKVILIGNPRLYHMLHQYDEDFDKLFKVRADFDVEMDRNPANLMGYASFISSHSRREALRHFDRTAVAKIIEFSSRLADDQRKLSTRFGEIVDILYEANAWAEASGMPVVNGDHVKQAIEEKIYRSNLMEEKIQEAIQRGRLLVDVSGRVVGQVNGLSVMGIGDHFFGRPSRITARIYMGEKGVVNIERETELSGRIHDKGLLTLIGYLGGRYAQNRPLTLSASITFEQLYSGVDGDSASSAELYALLSALAGLPIDQGIAVTGSINQYGQIQPIGGVNEKIEGFFAACKALGMTGRQGVVIPVQNVENLMLKDEVVEAVRDGRFHIWAISTVDEGLALLTGVPAGEPDEQGQYPPDTVHGRVHARLEELAQGLKAFGVRGAHAPGARRTYPEVEEPEPVPRDDGEAPW